MRKKSYFAAVATSIVLCSMMLFAGCQQSAVPAPTKSGEDVIKDGVKKLMEIASAGYQVSLKGDVNDKGAGDTKLDFAFSGVFDRKDATSPFGTVKAVGSFSTGDAATQESVMSGSGSAELRLNTKALYFNVADITFTGQEQVIASYKAYFAKWWKYTLSEDIKAEFVNMVPKISEDKDISPEQKQINALLESTVFFPQPTFVGTESVGGEQSYHYTVVLDKKAAVNFYVESSKINGTVMTEDEIASLNTIWAGINITGDIYVGTVSGTLNKANINVKLNKVGDTETTGTLSFGMVLSGVNGVVTLEEPKDAVEFPIEDFMGASGTIDESEVPSEVTKDSVVTGGDFM
jgi:hypothetical protein